jgi:hypothetical protein
LALHRFGTCSSYSLFPNEIRALNRSPNEDDRSVSTFFIILLIWLAPGLLVFLYLLWVSKRGSTPVSEAPAVPMQPKQEEQVEHPARKEAAKGT